MRHSTQYYLYIVIETQSSCHDDKGVFGWKEKKILGIWREKEPLVWIPKLGGNGFGREGIGRI